MIEDIHNNIQSGDFADELLRDANNLDLSNVVGFVDTYSLLVRFQLMWK